MLSGPLAIRQPQLRGTLGKGLHLPAAPRELLDGQQKS